MKKVLLSGYYGFDNSGDDAILKAIVKDLRSRQEDIDIVVLSNNPKKTEKIYKVKSVNRFKFSKVMEAMRETDLFISGGGSLLQDVTSNRSLWYYLMIMKLAIFYKKPFMVYANGIGPINNVVNRKMTRDILNKAAYITLRDEDSKEFVDNLGVKNENILVTADPVFTLEASKKDKIDKIFQEEKIPSDEKLIGISIRQWENDELLISSLVTAMDYIYDKYKYKFLIIPMHHPEDLNLSKKLLARLSKDCGYVIEDKYSVEDIMGIIKNLDLIVAMRLHALIYAATQNIPIVGLVYDPKLTGLLKELEINNSLNVDSVNAEDLIKNLEYVIENREILSISLSRHEKIFEKKALENIEIVMEILYKK